MTNKATFKNGDEYQDHFFIEDGVYYFIAKDKDGNEYETNETPVLRIVISLPDGVQIIAA